VSGAHSPGAKGLLLALEHGWSLAWQGWWQTQVWGPGPDFPSGSGKSCVSAGVGGWWWVSLRTVSLDFWMQQGSLCLSQVHISLDLFSDLLAAPKSHMERTAAALILALAYKQPIRWLLIPFCPKWYIWFTLVSQ
jgi:hypothetical protein